MEKQVTNPRPALGKGLASLLPSANQTASTEAAVPPSATNSNSTSNSPGFEKVEEKSGRVPGITMVDVNSVETNTYQPRRDFDETALNELADSIRSKGIIQPLIIRKSSDGKFHLIAGERRLRAAKIAGVKQVPVVIRQSSDKETLEIALIENIQRENLNCIEIALSYFQLIEDFQLTQEEVSKRVGKERSTIANHIRLLKLPEEIIKDLRENKLTFGHGKALLALKDSMQRMQVRNKILEKSLSVRETEDLITQILSEPTKNSPSDEANSKEDEMKENLRHVAHKIGRAYGAKVMVKGSEYKGSIVIKYFSKDDLNHLVEQLLG